MSSDCAFNGVSTTLDDMKTRQKEPIFSDIVFITVCRPDTVPLLTTRPSALVKDNSGEHVATRVTKRSRARGTSYFFPTRQGLSRVDSSFSLDPITLRNLQCVDCKTKSVLLNE